jgi:hypothetical protein
MKVDFTCLFKMGYLSKLVLLSFVQSFPIMQVFANNLHYKRMDPDDDEPGLKGTESERNRAHIAHGVVISLAAVILLPFGAILLRTVNPSRAVQIHGIFQIFSMTVLLIGFALGVWLTYLHNEVRLSAFLTPKVCISHYLGDLQ